MPKPNAGEKKADYLKRCMSEYADKYPDEKQRYAVCNSVFDRESGSAEEKAHAIMMLEVFEWKEEDHPRNPKGESDGGKFAPSAGGGGGGDDGEPAPKDAAKAYPKDFDPKRVDAALDALDPDRKITTGKANDKYAQWPSAVSADTKEARAAAKEIGGEKGKKLRDAAKEWRALHDPSDEESMDDPMPDLDSHWTKRLLTRLHEWRQKYGADGLKELTAQHTPGHHAWNEGDHPRHPKGEGDGGKFAPKDGGDAGGNAPIDQKHVDEIDYHLNRGSQTGAKKAARSLAKGLDAVDPDKAKEVREAAKSWFAMVEGKDLSSADAQRAANAEQADWQKKYGADSLNDYIGAIADKMRPAKKHARVEVVSSGRGGERINFNAAFSLEKSDPDKGTFSGTASMFGAMVDTYPPTRMTRGAFQKTLGDSSARDRVKILYQHNSDWPIGKPSAMRETRAGLEIAGSISKTSIGNDVLTLLRDGVLDELSVGFDPVAWRMVKEENQQEHVRHLDEVHLWEVSIVTFAADRSARILSVHSLPFQDLPLADIDHAWDAEAAVERVRKLVKDGYAQFKRAFVWTDGTVHRYPVADVIDGQLKAVPRAIFTAAARLSRKTDLSQADVLGAQAHLARYYKKLDRTPPWVMEEASQLRDAAEWLASLPATASVGRQAKAIAHIAREILSGQGKQLTARSRQSVEEAITTFQGLLRAAEPPLDGAATEKQRQDAVIGQRLRELNLAAIEAGILI